jgi:hypothetical protein
LPLAKILVGQQAGAGHPTLDYLPVSPALTFHVLLRTPGCGLSIRLVIARQRCKLGGKPS